MLTALLLRHGHAARGGNVPDHERALDDLGRGQAARVGLYVAERHESPELVLCSTATRARETVELALPKWGRRPAIAYDTRLYLTDSDVLLRTLAATPDGIERVMLVGHNPALRQLAVELVGEPAATDRLGGLPTGALAVLSFDGPWAAVWWGSAGLVDVAFP